MTVETSKKYIRNILLIAFFSAGLCSCDSNLLSDLDNSLVEDGFDNDTDQEQAAPEPTPNTAPSISSLADQSIIENTSTSALAFTIDDAEQTLDCSTSVTMNSSNTTLIENQDVVFSGALPNCQATFTPNANEIGTSTLTLTVDDGQLTAQTTMEITSTRELTLISGAYEYTNGVFAFHCDDYLNSPYYNNEGSGTYRIDPDGAAGNAQYTVYCDMTIDGGGWTRIFYHDTTDGAFTNKTQAQNNDQISPASTKYSILDQVSLFDASPYEFYMNWPGNVTCGGSPHHWTQTSNPMTTSEAVTGYNAISGGTTVANGSKGLCLSSQGTTLLDGNCGHGNWWYAIGQVTLFGGGIPGCGSPSQTIVELYVR